MLLGGLHKECKSSFGTSANSTFITDRKATTLCENSDAILHHCDRAGHRVTNLSTDEEFEPLLGPLQDSDDLKIKMCFAAAQAHVPPAERNHKFLKERTRGTYQILPFKALPATMVKHMVVEVVKKLNHFPQTGGISGCSPSTMLGEPPLDYSQTQADSKLASQPS